MGDLWLNHEHRADFKGDRLEHQSTCPSANLLHTHSSAGPCRTRPYSSSVVANVAVSEVLVNTLRLCLYPGVPSKAGSILRVVSQ
jgi:hypothetical protein